MIGAMPAVAVRHERRRNEKRGGGRRPSQLPLQLGRPGEVEPTPSPDHGPGILTDYICGKLLALHAVVGTLLLGIVIMVVGVVQMSPGAEAAQHRYYFLGAGAVLMSTGVLGCALRCIFLHWFNRKYREDHRPEPSHKNGVSTVEAGHAHDKHAHAHDKPAHDKHAHDKPAHDKPAHDKHAHDKAAHDKPAHDKTHDAKNEKNKLKTQASVGREVDSLIKQPSATSEA